MNSRATAPRPPSNLKRDLAWLIALVPAFLLDYLFALLTRPPLVPPAGPPQAASNPEWSANLESMSARFRVLTQKAREFAAPAKATGVAAPAIATSTTNTPT